MKDMVYFIYYFVYYTCQLPLIWRVITTITETPTPHPPPSRLTTVTRSWPQENYNKLLVYLCRICLPILSVLLLTRSYLKLCCYFWSAPREKGGGKGFIWWLWVVLLMTTINFIYLVTWTPILPLPWHIHRKMHRWNTSVSTGLEPQIKWIKHQRGACINFRPWRCSESRFLNSIATCC